VRKSENFTCHLTVKLMAKKFWLFCNSKSVLSFIGLTTDRKNIKSRRHKTTATFKSTTTLASTTICDDKSRLKCAQISAYSFHIHIHLKKCKGAHVWTRMPKYCFKLHFRTFNNSNNNNKTIKIVKAQCPNVKQVIWINFEKSLDSFFCINLIRL